ATASRCRAHGPDRDHDRPVPVGTGRTEALTRFRRGDHVQLTADLDDHIVAVSGGEQLNARHEGTPFLTQAPGRGLDPTAKLLDPPRQDTPGPGHHWPARLPNPDEHASPGGAPSVPGNQGTSRARSRVMTAV